MSYHFLPVVLCTPACVMTLWYTLGPCSPWPAAFAAPHLACSLLCPGTPEEQSACHMLRGGATTSPALTNTCRTTLLAGIACAEGLVVQEAESDNVSRQHTACHHQTVPQPGQRMA